MNAAGAAAIGRHACCHPWSACRIPHLNPFVLI